MSVGGLRVAEYLDSAKPFAPLHLGLPLLSGFSSRPLLQQVLLHLDPLSLLLYETVAHVQHFGPDLCSIQDLLG